MALRGKKDLMKINSFLWIRKLKYSGITFPSNSEGPSEIQMYKNQMQSGRTTRLTVNAIWVAAAKDMDVVKALIKHQLASDRLWVTTPTVAVFDGEDSRN